MPYLMDRYEDIPEEERNRIEYESYGQYLGKDFIQYINWIKKHQKNYGLIWWHRFDVLNFFCNIDNTKRESLRVFLEKEHNDLFRLLTQIAPDSNQIIEWFEWITKFRWKKIKEITGIFQKDLGYLFWEDNNNKLWDSLICYANKFEANSE